MNRRPDQPYFSGEVHRALGTVQKAAQFQQDLIQQFDQAIPGVQNLINACWDGSTAWDGNDSRGGVGLVCDVCLPGRPKFTIVKARPFKGRNNSVLVEMNGALEACSAIKEILRYAQANGLLTDLVGPINITMINDCHTVMSSLSKTSCAPMLRANLKRIEPIITRIKDASEQIYAFSPKIKLDLHFCPRNLVSRTVAVDKLSKLARISKKHFRSTIFYDPPLECVTHNYVHLDDTAAVAQLEAELDMAALQYPLQPQIRESRRRKLPGGTVVEEDQGLEDEIIDTSRDTIASRVKRRRVMTNKKQNKNGQRRFRSARLRKKMEAREN